MMKEKAAELKAAAASDAHANVAFEQKVQEMDAHFERVDALTVWHKLLRHLQCAEP